MTDERPLQETIDLATKKDLIDGAMCGGGWVYLYLGSQTVKLRDDVAATFLARLTEPTAFQGESARIYRLDKVGM